MIQKTNNIGSNDEPDRQTNSEIKAASELNLAQIMNTVGEGVIVTGKEWRFEYVNPAFARIMGDSSESLIGKSMDDFIVPGDLSILLKNRSERLEGKTTTYEFCLKRPDGEIVFVRATGVPRWIDDKVVGSISVIADLTERKQLDEKYLQLAAIVESSDDAIIGKSYDGIITSWNKGAEKIFGYSENEIIGQPISLLVPTEHRDEVSQILEKIQSGEHIDHYETVRQKKDGSRIHVSLTISPICDIRGKVIGGSTIARDISERKKAEEVLKGSKEYLNHIIDRIGDPIFVKDRQHRFILVNEATCRQLGRSSQDIIGRTTRDIFLTKETADISSEKDEEVFNTGRENINEETITYASGVTRTVLVKKTLYTDSDGNQFLVGAIRDITDRKQKEEAILRVKEDWERTFDSVPDLISIIDNEYRIIRANKAMATRLSVTPEECVGLKCYSVVHGTIEPSSFCPHRQLIEDGLDHTAEVHEDRIGGDFIVSVSPLIGQEGKLTGCVHVARDITERKRAEEAMRSLAKFPEENPNPVLRVTSEGVLAFANPSSDPLLKLWDCQVGQDVPNDLRELVLSAFKSKEVREIDVVYGEVSYSLVITPIKDTGHVNIYGMDITERKKTEMKLARELNKFKVLYDLTLDMSAEKSLEENFAFIVDKSRDLLNADTSYIALLDETSQEVRMHTLSGIRTEAFKQMHLPLGKGLYGLVMETHQGYIIDDYFKNRDLKHIVDQIIADEGLVSGMAVPIQIKELSLGVLYVFNRHKTQFTQEDLDTLAPLGNLAAVEIIREKSSNALREQLNFLQQLIDSMPNPIFYKNTLGVYQGCNKAFETSTGLAKEKIVGKTVYELYDKDLADIYYKADNKLFQNPGVQVYEASIINNNGTRNNVMFNKATYLNSEGRIAGLVGVILDITERKRMEIALRESERRLADIINFLPDATMVIDKEGRVIAWNRAIEVLTGIKAEEMLGKGNHEHALPFYGQRRPILIDLVLKPQEEIEESYSNMKRKGDSLVGEAYMPMLGGGETYLWGVASALYDSQGAIVGAIESIKDITDRKHAEEALKESECRLADIINFLPDATVVIDKYGKVISWNQAIEAMTGVKAEDILGKGDYEHAIPFYGQRRPVLIDLVLQSQDEFDRNYSNIGRKNGTLAGEAYVTNLKGAEAYLFGTAAALYDSKRNIVGAIESIRDITERKRAEVALQKARDELEQRVEERTSELETKNSEMERFIYTVSHDLRTPLISMSGFMGFLKQDLERGDLKRVEEDLRIVNDAVKKMDQLLMETLELSRIGRVVNPPDDVPFVEIVEDALRQIRSKIESKGFKVSVAQNMPVVNVDRMRIAEVLSNLMENSIKYTGSQENPEIEIGLRIDGKDRIFFVRDNGIGIDPSQHEKIFELFYKIDKKSEGSGAGLAIVKKIIEVHGGHIWIESELGKGCTICFTLPLADNQ